MLLSEAWEMYVADKQLEGYSHHTLKAYKIQINLLIRFMGDKNIKNIEFEHLKGYLANEAKRLKPSSVGHRVRFLKSVFRWAHEEGILLCNPTAKLKEPKLGKRIPKAVGEETVELLREGCKTVRDRAIFEFFYTTGCRIGEIVKLNRNSVNFDSRSCIVRGKGDKEREVYFNVSCQIYLRRYLKQRTDNDMALFVTKNAPHRCTTDSIRYTLKRIAERAGVANIYPHKLRHTYATHLLNNGAPLEIIQSLLGHEKSETTRLYAHLSGSLRREQYRKYF